MRLFVGVELDERVRAAAADAAEQIRARLKQSRVDLIARWVEPENLHVTLWFIGEAKDERAQQVERVLRPPFVTRSFDLHVRGCGAFPPSGPPRVIWLGISSGADSMIRIYEELKARLAGLGFEAEKRPYSPHLTLARVKGVRSRFFGLSSSSNRALTPTRTPTPTSPTQEVRSRFSRSSRRSEAESKNRDLTPTARARRTEHRDLTPGARAVREALAAVPADCGACRVGAVTLFRSHLSPRGSRYEPLLRVPLS